MLALLGGSLGVKMIEWRIEGLVFLHLERIHPVVAKNRQHNVRMYDRDANKVETGRDYEDGI